MQHEGSSPLSGGAWLSVSLVQARVICGFVKVQSQVTNIGTERGQACLLLKTEWDVVFALGCEDRANGMETLVIIRW